MDPGHRKRSRLGLLGIIVVGALLTACSSSVPPSSTSATVMDRSQGLCTLITAADVEATTGFRVGAPSSVIQVPTTDCNYPSSNPSHIVFIRYNAATTDRMFTAKRDAIATSGTTETAVPGLGEEAFLYSQTSGGTTKTTVVARQGPLMVTVSGTATTPAQVESLARTALERAR